MVCRDYINCTAGFCTHRKVKVPSLVFRGKADKFIFSDGDGPSQPLAWSGSTDGVGTGVRVCVRGKGEGFYISSADISFCV
jgi:hypothetical protein